MEQATPAVLDLVRLVLTLEANHNEHAPEEAHTALSALDKLRSHLSKLVGGVGFQALLARALALAKVEVSWLAAVRIQADATLEGFREAAQQQSTEAVAEGNTALLTQLFSLLATFIGDALTLRLVADVWPEVQGNEQQFSAKEARHE